MPPRRWRQRIEDILEAADRIHGYITGLDEPAFCANRGVVDAVCMNLVVIGEAARHVPAEISTTCPEIPWAELRDMRNLIAHEYFGINSRIVWRTAVADVPEIVPLLRELLAGTVAE